MKKVIFALSLMISLSASAMDTVNYYPISKIWSWAEYQNGVILIQLENQHNLCPNGYWIEASRDSSAVNILSIALSAYHAKTPVRIFANENSDWTGLESKECEIQLMVLE